MNIGGLVWEDCRRGSVSEQGSFHDSLLSGTQPSDLVLIPGGSPLFL